MRSFTFAGSKKLMNALLLTPLFDSFETASLTIRTFCLFSAEPSGEDAPYPLWGKMRPVATELLRGNKKPDQIKLILKLSGEDTEKVLASSGADIAPEAVGGLFLNILYRCENDLETLTATTGISLKAFSLDRSLENFWDKMIESFFEKHDFPLKEPDL